MNNMDISKHVDVSYSQLLHKVLVKGHDYEDPNRKGVFRKEIHSHTFRHSFEDGFPAISTKKLFYGGIVTELVWFLLGDTNIKFLLDNGCNIWNKDAYNYYLQNLKPNQSPMSLERFIEVVKTLNVDYVNKNRSKLGYVIGDLGPVYGKQWVNSTKTTAVGGGHCIKKHINQIQNLMVNMIERPMSSELVVNAWNPTEVDEMALPPCHYGFQVIMIPLDNGKYGFELHWNQRSCDLFLGKIWELLK